MLTLNFKQKIFTKVKNHLLTQNKKCVDKNGDCKLRDQDNQCAASCLIPENDYSEKMEPCYHWKFFEDSGYSQDEIELITDLVCIHDGYEPIEWENKLRELAMRENLVF